MCHVLIIEDQTLIALDLQDLLEAHGALSFSFAGSQQEAIDASRETRPDVILSDVGLPEGTGPLAVQAIRAEFGMIPAIFVTATPEACTPCCAGDKIFRKPLDRPAIGTAFRRIAFAA